MCSVQLPIHVDDIVLLAPDNESLQSMLVMVEESCRERRMKLNIDKCTLGRNLGARKDQSITLFYKESTRKASKALVPLNSRTRACGPGVHIKLTAR